MLYLKFYVERCGRSLVPGSSRACPRVRTRRRRTSSAFHIEEKGNR
jgi:hypothetical protein